MNIAPVRVAELDLRSIIVNPLSFINRTRGFRSDRVENWRRLGRHIDRKKSADVEFNNVEKKRTLSS